MLNKLQLSDFCGYSKKELDEILLFNENCNIELHEVEKLSYIKIYDIFKNPEDVKNFLVKFPFEDRTKSIFEKTKTNIKSSAPGFQQPIDESFFYDLSKNIFNILQKHNFCKYDYEKTSWKYYTNCCYPGMKSINRNYLPHVDKFTYACNIYLTNNKNSGTSFFKYNGKNGSYYSISELMRHHEIEFADYYTWREQEIHVDRIEEWQAFEGNEKVTKYHLLKSDYNSCSIYRGHFWHSIFYDAKNDPDIRYSLVGSIT